MQATKKARYLGITRIDVKVFSSSVINHMFIYTTS